MSEYLARVEHINGFINIRPVMEFVDEGLSEVDESKFGSYGTITVGGSSSHSEAPLLQNQCYSIFQITDAELNALESTMSGSKIRASDFLQKAKIVDRSIIRETIVLPKSFRVKDFPIWGKDFISDIMQPITKSIYLMDEHDVAGPFTWEASQDGKYKFIPKSQHNDHYIVDCFNRRDFDVIYTFEAGKRYEDAYYGRNRYVIKFDALPESYTVIDCIDDKGLKDVIGRLITQSAETRQIQRGIRNAVNDLPEDQISDTRKERILKLVQNGELADQAIRLIPSIILQDEDQSDNIANAILSNANYIEKLYPIVKTKEGFQSILDKLESEKIKREAEISELEKRISEATETNTSVIGANPEEITKLTKEIDDLGQQLEGYRNAESAKLDIDKLQKDYEELQNKYNTALSMKNNVSEDISKKIREAYTSFAIDGELSSLILKEASEFERQKNKKNIESAIATVEKITLKSEMENPNELINFLYNELTQKASRNISKNDIANILLCVSQGFLTVFAGEPGTGKTSLVSLLASILGLSNEKFSRYVEIAVEKGWTSRRDLIGYYNPLTKTFDATSKGLFSALSTLKAEYDSGISDFPYWVLLDEANLSQMEHYWADFMSLCDMDKKYRKVSLNENYEFPIPQTLRFLATINLDHTTEVLSPRLIDRAWIVMLKSTDLDIEDYETSSIDDTYPLTSYKAFHALCDPSQWKSTKLDPIIVSKFQSIRDCFQNNGVRFSPRIIGMIKRYCLASTGIIDTADNSYAALDYAVAQKILPLINGYGDNYGQFIEDLIKECDQNTMPISNNLLRIIQRKGSDNMPYYQFFSR